MFVLKLSGMHTLFFTLNGNLNKLFILFVPWDKKRISEIFKKKLWKFYFFFYKEK